MYMHMTKECRCGIEFTPKIEAQIYCCKKCRDKYLQRAVSARRKHNIKAGRVTNRYTDAEIAILKSDPWAKLPNRTYDGVYSYCKKHGILRGHAKISEISGTERRAYPKNENHNRKRDLARHQDRIRRDGGKAVNRHLKQIVPNSPRRAEIISEAFIYIMDHRCTPEEAVKHASKTVSRFYAEEFRTCEFNDAWMQMPESE